jgi:hypothetical protein
MHQNRDDLANRVDEGEVGPRSQLGVQEHPEVEVRALMFRQPVNMGRSGAY